MYRRARRFFLTAALMLGPHLAFAQPVRQPTPVPLVTAENEPWYRDGSPIQWTGEFYYPAGAPQAFDPYAMTPAGSYHGIPLYTDTTVAPYTRVFVPIAGARMQPYEHLPAGLTPPPLVTADMTPANPPQPVGTSGHATASGPVSTAIPPKGINNAWIEFDGSRWVADGKAIPRTDDMQEVGQHRGFSVYARGSVRATIYVPSVGNLVVPFVRR
jgi:hypothetical protein